MSTEPADFHLRHEAAEELKRLATHPVQEVGRLEHEALDGATAASLGIVILGVFVGVTVLVALMYALVEIVTRLAT